MNCLLNTTSKKQLLFEVCSRSFVSAPGGRRPKFSKQKQNPANLGGVGDDAILEQVET